VVKAGTKKKTNYTLKLVFVVKTIFVKVW